MTGRIIQNSNLIEVRQGDSLIIKLKLRKQGHDFDLTGATVTMQVRKYEDNQLLFSLLATEIDLKKGVVALIITPAQSNVEVGDYKTDIQLATPDGHINTIFPADVNRIGIFRVTEQVTDDR